MRKGDLDSTGMMGRSWVSKQWREVDPSRVSGCTDCRGKAGNKAARERALTPLGPSPEWKLQVGLALRLLTAFGVCGWWVVVAGERKAHIARPPGSEEE